jgi:hypothetical protein
MGKSEAEIRAELAEVELEAAKIRLEQVKEENQEFMARKDQRKRANAQRQQQFKTTRQETARAAKQCSHRQGASLPNARTGGKMSSALHGVYLPQDERRLVMCAICPLRVWEPRPIDGAPKARKGETEAALQKRLTGYAAKLKAFETLWEAAQDQLTDEAGRPMHCGKTFTFSDTEGNRAHVPHPCDGYAQGLDNREAA